MAGSKKKKEKKVGTKKKKIVERRDEVFNAILDIVSQSGMNALTTSKIAKKLGVSQPAIYRYFKDKNDMFLFFIEELKNNLKGIVEKSQKEDKGNKIIKLLDLHFKFLKETKAMPSIIFSGYLFKRGDEKREKMKGVIDFYRAQVENLFKEEGMPEEFLPIASDIIIGTLLSFDIRWIYENDFDFQSYLELIKKYIFSFIDNVKQKFDKNDVMI